MHGERKLALPGRIKNGIRMESESYVSGHHGTR